MYGLVRGIAGVKDCYGDPPIDVAAIAKGARWQGWRDIQFIMDFSGYTIVYS